MHPTKKTDPGPFYMLLCAFLWSIAGIFIKLIPWNSLVIAGWRSFIAMFCVIAYMKATHLRFSLNKLSVLNGIFLSLTFLLFVSANKLTTAANAIVLQTTAPVFILILSAVFLGQRFCRADYITVALTLGGISLFFFDQLSGGHLTGNILGVLSGFTMGCMFVISGKADDSARMSGILMGHLFTALVGIPMSFVFDTPVTKSAVACILVLGIVQLGIPYVLYGLAVRSCPPLVCSLLGTLEPLLNPVWVFIFDGEAPGPFALMGGVVVIVTITVWCVRKDKKVAA